MADDLKLKYDEWHAHRHVEETAKSPLDYDWYRSVYNHVKGKLSGNVLEVGCGRGAFAQWLSPQFPEISMTAIDFSSAAVELAQAANPLPPTQLEFRVGDAQSLEFPDQSFDWVISCECMEHVPDPAKMAAEIFRVLKPGGRFCLTTENYCNGMLIAWMQSWITRKPFGSGSGVQPRENFFLFPIVKRYLTAAGLKVDETESCHYQWLLLPRVSPDKLCTKHFNKPWQRALFKPFGRHFSFFGHRSHKTLTAHP